MTIVILKFVHFLCFSIGIGGGVANGIIGSRLSSMTKESAISAFKLQSTISAVMLMSLLLLWASGSLLIILIYGGFSGLPGSFHWKLTAAIALTLAVLALHVFEKRAKKANDIPSEKVVGPLGGIALLSAITAMALAIYTFG